MTHLPTTLIFSPIPVAFILLFAPPGERWNLVMKTLLGMSLGFGLSAAFLLPALGLQKYVSMEVMQEGHFFYRNHFFGSPMAGVFDTQVFWAVVSTLVMG